MKSFAFIIAVIVLFGKCRTLTFFVFMGRPLAESPDFDLVTREEWGAEDPKATTKMANPVPYVIIHHSYIPPACNTTEKCELAMQKMQNMHMNVNGWNDIGYNFAVGGDGKAYEGRGWSKVGAHSPSYNDKSIGICVIGDWSDMLPPKNQLDTVHKLIDYGVSQGMIQTNYTLFGHRQVRQGTECPGQTLYDEIQKWEHYQPEPPYVYLLNSNGINR